MNLVELEKKLIAAARVENPSDEVPFGFTTRVMARITSLPNSAAALWADALWKSAGACIVIVCVFCTISVLTFTPAEKEGSAGNLAQEFEKTMLAGLETDYPR
jgi:hypothetical protein